MAKKTNKTDHVLNLLAGASKKDESPEVSEETQAKGQPPVDPLEQMKSSVSVHHTSDNGDAPIADAVKQSLEEELLTAESVNQKNEAEVPGKPVKKKQNEANKDSLKVSDEQEESIQEGSKEEQIVTDKEEEPVLKEEPEESVVQEEPEAVPVQEEEIKPSEVNKNEPEPKEPEQKERTFEFVNVMERLVRDKVVGYMKQFGNCTCDRCIEDTTALALSHLPAKCVVVNKEAVSPLLNFYTNKYAGQITVEITKACIVVQNNPFH